MTQALHCRITTFCDCYRGTQEALISAGAAKPEWFARVGSRYAPGRKRRSFYDIENGRVTLRDYRKGIFSVVITVCDDEYRDRRAECDLFGQETGWLSPGMAPAAPTLRAVQEDRDYQRFMNQVLNTRKAT